MKRLLFLGFLSLFFIGLVGCGISGVELDPESQEFYKTARLVMTSQEKKIFKHLPSKESRKEFIQEFWEKRDPDAQTEVNEFKKIFQHRIEYANKHFDEGIPGWKTDRGRMYIYFGAPDKIDRYPMLSQPDIKGYQLWVYYRYNFAIEFVDKRGDNSYTFNPHYGVHGSFFNALENARLGLIQQDKEFTQKFMDFSLEYDSQKRKVVLTIPVKNLTFAQENDLLKAEFDFRFFIYRRNKPSQKDEFQRNRRFQAPEEEILDTKDLNFSFAFDLKPGKYFVDVIIIAKPDLGKTRKIFKVKI